MTTEKLKMGDKVILNSGGPIMTVETISGKNVSCCWSSGESVTGTYRSIFPIASVKLQDKGTRE